MTDSITTLLHSVESKQRIIAGLSWDVVQNPKVSLLDKILKREEDHDHDLDITCYIYNNKKEFIDFVGAEADVAIDDTGKIYHSGNDVSGEGEGDDEFISAELAVLPDHVHGIVFLVEVRSGHHFEDVAGASCRLADGKSNQDLLEISLKPQEGKGKEAFVFCAVFRDEMSITGWNLNKICDYPDLAAVGHWGNYLARYV